MPMRGVNFGALLNILMATLDTGMRLNGPDITDGKTPVNASYMIFQS